MREEDNSKERYHPSIPRSSPQAGKRYTSEGKITSHAMIRYAGAKPNTTQKKGATIYPPQLKKVRYPVSLIISGNELWCSFHRIEDHHIKERIQLKKEIKALIQHGKLSTYVSDVFSSFAGNKSPTHSKATRRRSYLKEVDRPREGCSRESRSDAP